MSWQAPVGATVEWFTPPDLFEALGLTFDLDPCAPATGAEWVPATRRYAIDCGENGLWLPWVGRVWLNPPYGEGAPDFVEKMIDHADGVALLPSRTETRWWLSAARSADSLVFLRQRLYFIRADGYRGRADHASTLMAWGEQCAEAIRRADLGWVSK